MRQLRSAVAEWSNLLPQQLQPIRRTQENIKCPLFRFYEREINTGCRLLRTVLSDLADVAAICDAHKKQTNYHRELLKDLAKGVIPKSWRRHYTVPATLVVQPWLIDFAERVRQLANIGKQFAENGGLNALKNYVVWLGGLFTPEAYITATRQYVAQSNSWSLEELALDIKVFDNVSSVGTLDACSFGLTGLKLQGAVCANNRIQLSTNIVNPFPVAVIKWAKSSPELASSQLTSKISLPIYLNATRADLLFTISMDTAHQEQNGDNAFFMRGVAILASNLG
jgi:dynein heavy chain 1